ncbi:MAG: hypothetical protein IT384_08080 [Deltaproteobacteria bacterium]|nr:hypothetical protein [Deltaproteobacteria bacterium]
MTTVAIIGAHTALARALEECLEEREIEVELSRQTTPEHLAEGLDPIDPDPWERADLVILALGGPVAEALAERARSRGRPLLDLGGAVAQSALEWVWPILDAEAGRRSVGAKTPAIAPGLAAPLVAVLRALAELSPKIAQIATYESAALADRAGMDGLSEEVRAIFSLQEVESPVFGERLAFNALPLAGEALAASLLPEDRGAGAREACENGAAPRPSADHREAAHEDRLEAAVKAGLGGGGPELRVTRVVIPAFSAEGAAVDLVLDGEVDHARVEALLRGARGVRYLPGDPPGSGRALERDDTLVSWVRTSPGRLALWIAADRLRAGSATQAALFIEQWLATRLA